MVHLKHALVALVTVVTTVRLALEASLAHANTSIATLLLNRYGCLQRLVTVDEFFIVMLTFHFINE